MAQSADDISNAIRAQLKIIDPDISAEPLTPERKIIDTVAEAIADAEVDKFVLQYQFDIDTKVGTDLDKFVAMFGFARQGGDRATGSVTFTMDSPATADAFISVGTQIATTGSSLGPPITFITTASTVIFQGTTSAIAPVQASNIGTSGNVPANTIIQFTNASINQASLSNPTATSGGSDIETDAELRLRFKNTIFRNVAGTKDQYLALAISSKFANKANVIGPVDRFIEYIQVASNLTATSVIPYSKYTYNFDYYLTQPGNIGNEIFFNPGVDYTFTNSVPPSFTINIANAANDFVAGSVLLLEHSYNSVNSRNDPANNKLNYIDVYVAGEQDQDVSELTAFPMTSGTNAVLFTTTTGTTYFVNSYKRAETSAAPAVGNAFQKLFWQPITALPSSIMINGNAFYEDSDYFLVKDTTVYKGSKRATDGIEWGARAISTVASGTNYNLDYVFNKLIITLNELMDSHKQIGTDVLVHAATKRYLIVNLIIIYEPGSTKTGVDSNITLALTDFFNKLNFGAVIQISDILEITHEVSGVDNVRLARPGDGVSFGIQEVAADGVTLIGSPYTSDFFLQDSDLPVLNSVVTTRRSQNTWTP